MSMAIYIFGGGTAFLILEPAVLFTAPIQFIKSFEMSSVTLKLFSSNLTIFNVHRPPPVNTETRKLVPFSDFLSDLDTLLFLAAITLPEFLITGDFNFRLYDDYYYLIYQQFFNLLPLLSIDKLQLNSHIFIIY